MKPLRVWMSLFLASLTTACASPPGVTKVEYQQVYLPDRFLLDCSAPEWGGGTYRDVAALAARRGAALESCNRQLRSAREYQAGVKALGGAAYP